MPEYENTEAGRILIIDDQLVNLKMLKSILTKAGFTDLHLFQNPIEALEQFDAINPDLVLLDFHMPQLSGLEVLRALGPRLQQNLLPVLILTSDESASIREEAFRIGAIDHFLKPFDRVELVQRVHNFLRLRFLHEAVRQSNSQLEARVELRTQQLRGAWMEILDRLSRATALRDEITGNHVERVGNLCFEIALELGHSEFDAEQIGLAARLHDVGKIGVSDTILNKVGKLSFDEMEIMKSHTTVGANILGGGTSTLVVLAREIALWHHERWDGSGYPDGLIHEQIPLSARICAIADVFDSLTHARSYKTAWSIEATLAEIEAHAGTQFDPDVVAAFCRVIERLDDPASLIAA